MTTPRALTRFERVFLSFMQGMSELSEGYSVAFAEELIRQHGVSGFFKWAKGTMVGWNELVGAYGEQDAHMLAAFASFWNGCDYCAYGHVLAYNLHVFKESGELFPIDEAEVPQLLRERDEVLLGTLRQRLAAPQYARMLRLLERQYALKFGLARAESDEDRLLERSIALYEWVNECSIMAEAPAPPLGRIAKQRALRTAYDEARRKARPATAA